MSIKLRFGLCLGVVLLLHLFTAVMGHIGLERAQRDFHQYEQVNADTIALLSIDHSITELQRGVTLFIHSGHDAAAERVRELLGQTSEKIDAALVQSEQQRVSELLTAMAGVMESYEFNFEKVAIDRASRIELVHDRMLPLRARVLGLLESDQLTGGEPYEGSLRVTEHLLQAESAALRYFDSPSRLLVDEALYHLSVARTELDALSLEDARRDEADGLLDEYRGAFIEAVQATRGYLHLVNVVLAGQAAELLYDSSAIRMTSLAQREELRATMQAASTRFQILSDLIAFITVLGGVVMASLVTRSVLKPILGMTGTLRQLATGDSSAPIVGLARTDEIGDMAAAAEVFRLKNLQTESLLEDSQQMAGDLARRNGEMTEFVYTVSHDLKSPLVTIQGYAGMLGSMAYAGDPEPLRDAAGRIERASNRMYETLEDLLELSRVGMVADTPAQLDLRRVTESVLADLQRELNSSDSEVHIAVGVPMIWADEVKLRQILQNLIANSLRHGKPESGTQHIEIGADRRPEGSVLWVADNGRGIDGQFADKVFGIFQRLSAATPGTGVGLAIVKKIAESHGGRAWLDAEYKNGAKFCVLLPDPAPAAHAA